MRQCRFRAVPITVVHSQRITRFGAGGISGFTIPAREQKSLPGQKRYWTAQIHLRFLSLRVLHTHAQFNSISLLFVGAKITMVNWVLQSRPVFPGLVQSRTLPLHQHCHSGRATHARSPSRGRSCVGEAADMGFLVPNKKTHLTSL